VTTSLAFERHAAPKRFLIMPKPDRSRPSIEQLKRQRELYGEDGRSEAREKAVSILYEAFAKERPANELMHERVLAIDSLTSELLDGIASRADEIDGLITKFVRGWTLERMAVIDRSVLRLGVFELLARPTVPAAVIFDEAVELANRYGTDDSGRFVNGLLAAIGREVRPGEVRPRPMRVRAVPTFDVKGEPGVAPGARDDEDEYTDDGTGYSISRDVGDDE
jgi:transcription antitermination protein NusB